MGNAFKFTQKQNTTLGVSKLNAFAEVAYKPLPPVRMTANAKFVGKAAGTYDVVYNNTAGNAAGTTPVIADGPAVYPRQYMPGYTLVGLSGSWQVASLLGTTKKVELGFDVDNLFDRHYLSGLGQELATSNPLTSGRYFLGSPRTFYVSLRAEL